MTDRWLSYSSLWCIWIITNGCCQPWCFYSALKCSSTCDWEPVNGLIWLGSDLLMEESEADVYRQTRWSLILCVVLSTSGYHSGMLVLFFLFSCRTTCLVVSRFLTGNALNHPMILTESNLLNQNWIIYGWMPAELLWRTVLEHGLCLLVVFLDERSYPVSLVESLWWTKAKQILFCSLSPCPLPTCWLQLQASKITTKNKSQFSLFRSLCLSVSLSSLFVWSCLVTGQEPNWASKYYQNLYCFQLC